MAIAYTGGTQNQTELQEIQREIYSDWGTLEIWILIFLKGINLEQTFTKVQ